MILQLTEHGLHIVERIGSLSVMLMIHQATLHGFWPFNWPGANVVQSRYFGLT